MKPITFSCYYGALFLAVCAQTTRAQTVDGVGRTAYPQAYFTAFGPTTALDVVKRVPGFILEEVDQETRGFSQTAGNVLISGARPTSKSDTLETLLSRIPAARVLRVEVGPGSLFGAEHAGKAQIVNVVLTAGGGLSGNTTVAARRDFRGRVRPEASASADLRTGTSSINASVTSTNRPFPEVGTDVVKVLPNGTVSEFRRKFNDARDIDIAGALAGEIDSGPNKSARLNIRLSRGRFTLDQTNQVEPATGPEREDRLSQDYHRRDFEVGGDVTRPLLGGGLKLVALMTSRQRLFNDQSFVDTAGPMARGFDQRVENERNETLARLTWTGTGIAGWTVEAGLEGALNTLDSTVNLFAIGSGGSRTRIDLPVDRAIVKERRGEAFVNAGRPLDSRLRIDLGLTFEMSKLMVGGDALAERSLSFLRPKLALDWQPAPGWKTQASLTRTVAQLNFEDFISTAELANDRINGGNAELLPQRAWEVRATVERTLMGDGLIKLELGYDAITLLQDRVPTLEGFDAPGNLGSGRQTFLRGTLDVPLAKLGIPGGRLTVNGTLQDNSVIDPYTARSRNFSGVTLWDLDVALRRDLGKLSYGVNYDGRPVNRVFRRAEIDAFSASGAFVDAFAEYRPDTATSVRLGLSNILGVEFRRTRTFFAPDRSSQTPTSVEERFRRGYMTATVTVKRSFG